MDIDADARIIDFQTEDVPGHTTWAALGFQPDMPIRFRYSFQPVSAGCGLLPPEDSRSVLTLRAEADIDGDGQLSAFERDATISEALELVPLGPLHALNRVE